MPYRTQNPATGEILREFPEAPASEAFLILEKIKEAQAEWANTSLEERARVIGSLGKLLEEKRDFHAAFILQEVGKPLKQCQAELEKCAQLCEFFAQKGSAFLEDEIIKESDGKARLTFEPLGIVLGIMPWNYPYWQVIRALVPAILAGNGILLKHASNVPQCALALEALFQEAGFPVHLFRTVFLKREDIPLLVVSPPVNAVSLTGSTKAGEEVAGLAGTQLKRTVFELGGSDPYIVFEDADIELAAQECAKARLVNGGQSCIAAKRFLVHNDVAQSFLKVFYEEMADALPGNPEKENTQLGPLAREDLRDNLHRQVSEAISDGAKLVLGGEIPEGPGYFYPATILTNVEPDMALWSEETFGPVAPVMTFDSEDEALRLANKGDFGLGAALFTADQSRADRISRRLHAAMVSINKMLVSAPERPFGGFGKSGWGWEAGKLGARTMTKTQVVNS